MSLKKGNFLEFVLTAPVLSTSQYVYFTASKNYIKNDGSYYDLNFDGDATVSITNFRCTLIKTDKKIEGISINGVTVDGTTSDGRNIYKGTIEIADDTTTKMRGLTQEDDGTNAVANVKADLIIDSFDTDDVLRVAWDIAQNNYLQTIIESSANDFSYQGVYDSGTTYDKYNIVFFDSDSDGNFGVFSAKETTTGNDPTDTSKWRTVIPEVQQRFVYVAYASADDGTGFNLTPSQSLAYRAELVSNVEISTPVLADFSGSTWVKYIGDSYQYIAYGTDNAGAGFSLTASDSLKYRAEFVTDIYIATPVLADFTSASAVWVKYIGDDGVIVGGLNALDDVTLTTPTAEDLLIRGATDWENKSISDLTDLNDPASTDKVLVSDSGVLKRVDRERFLRGNNLNSLTSLDDTDTILVEDVSTGTAKTIAYSSLISKASLPYTNTNIVLIKAYFNTSRNYSPGADTKITFNLESYDIGSDFDTTLNRFTAPRSGYYEINYKLSDNDGTNRSTNEKTIRINNVTVVNSIAQNSESYQDIVFMSSGQYLEAFIKAVSFTTTVTFGTITIKQIA